MTENETETGANAAPPRATRLLRLPEVSSRVGLGRDKIYRMGTKGTFPKPIKIDGGFSSAWIESEIDEWIASRIAAARPATKGEA